MKLGRSVVAATFSACVLASAMSAYGGEVTTAVIFDEWGTGFAGPNIMPGGLGPDPTPSGLAVPVMIYNLPYAGTPGDVLIHDPGVAGAPIFDVVRFDGAGHMMFYSDNVDGFIEPADTPGPPSPLLANQLNINETGPEGNNFATWFPTPGQPGYDAVFLPLYTAISDGHAPEPASLGILSAAGLMMLIRRRK